MNTPRELELMDILERANNEVVKLREELAEERRKAKIYNDAFKAGSDLMLLKKGMVDAGLTERQAFSLILAQLNKM